MIYETSGALLPRNKGFEKRKKNTLFYYRNSFRSLSLDMKLFIARSICRTLQWNIIDYLS